MLKPDNLPTNAELSELEAFPNLQAVLQNTIAGPSTDWPLVAVELRALLRSRAAGVRALEDMRQQTLRHQHSGDTLLAGVHALETEREGLRETITEQARKLGDLKADQLHEREQAAHWQAHWREERGKADALTAEVEMLKRRNAELEQENMNHSEDWAFSGIPLDSQLAQMLVVRDRLHKAEAELERMKRGAPGAQ